MTYVFIDLSHIVGDLPLITTCRIFVKYVPTHFIQENTYALFFFLEITIHQLYDMERLFHVNIVFELFARNARKDDNDDRYLFDDVDEVIVRNDDNDIDARRENESDPDRDTDKPDKTKTNADYCTRDPLLTCKLIRRSLCHFPTP